MAASFLSKHPDLRKFMISNVTLTGKAIGSGSYGSVEEVAIPGAVCAAKRIHEWVVEENDESIQQRYLEECRKMSSLRHPYIVQFLGICLLPGSPLPALVMEKMWTSLHDILDPGLKDSRKTSFSLSMKCSILHNVASGLSFLHRHTIIHRDLSAKNVLLNKGLVAKVADLGMARIVPTKPVPMTKAPGTPVYMPPEALEDISHYDASIDIFSLGVLTIFTLSGTFPVPMPATFTNAEQQLVSRTEYERREKYMQKISIQLGETHILVDVIKFCLSNLPHERPDAQTTIKYFQLAKDMACGEHDDIDKLSLIQTFHRKLESQAAQIQSLEEEIDIMKNRNEALCSRAMEGTLTEVEHSMEGRTRSETSFTPTKSSSLLQSSTSVVYLTFKWKEGSELPINDPLIFGSSVRIGTIVYCGNRNSVLKYEHESGKEWSELPRPPVGGFTVASIKGKMVLAGGNASGQIREFDHCSRKWKECGYPPMIIGRDQAAAVSYGIFLLVGGGSPYDDSVEILDTFNGKWYKAQPIPLGAHQISSVVVGDYWYLSSYGYWKDGHEHLFYTHLPSLISNAKSGCDGEILWHELPKAPVAQPTLVSFCGHLLLVGGWGYEQELYRYEVENRGWKGCGQLPTGLEASFGCTVSPKELIVFGGLAADTATPSKRMWIGKLDD